MNSYFSEVYNAFYILLPKPYSCCMTITLGTSNVEAFSNYLKITIKLYYIKYLDYDLKSHIISSFPPFFPSSFPLCFPLPPRNTCLAFTMSGKIQRPEIQWWTKCTMILASECTTPGIKWRRELSTQIWQSVISVKGGVLKWVSFTHLRDITVYCFFPK